MSEMMKLYSYWRSSAAYRVRIALNLKGLRYEQIPVNLAQGDGEQNEPAYRDVNPQRFVPVLVDGERVIRQSLAIVEYLEETVDGPRLLPATARERARVRSLSLLVACDIHPLNNTRVLKYLAREFATPDVERDRWIRHWISEGFDALQDLLDSNPSTGTYCEGDTPSMADLCLVPQAYNARRFGLDVARWPTIARIEAACLALPAFDAARPEIQPDAPRA
jgi:maleylacetoacetate isomerase